MNYTPGAAQRIGFENGKHHRRVRVIENSIVVDNNLADIVALPHSNDYVSLKHRNNHRFPTYSFVNCGNQELVILVTPVGV